MRSSRVNREWAGGRNSIFSNGRFKEEDAIFKVSCRPCLEEFSCRKSGYFALIYEVDRSLSERRFSRVNGDKKYKNGEKKNKKKKGKEKRSKSPFNDFFFAPLKARARIDCAIKTRTGLKK